MARDMTDRGGLRIGSGRKPKGLAEKIEAGNPGGRRLMKIDIPDMPAATDMETEEIPPPQEYLSALQRDGTPLGAADIYKTTYRWLANLRCEKLITPQMLEQYAICAARWVQCEQAITRYGFLGKRGNTPIPSPYIAMGMQYMKQTNQIWYQIYQIVKENCSVDISGPNPQDDVMEMLLRSRKG